MAGKNFDISKFAAGIKPVRSESDTMMEIPVDDIRDNPRNFYPTPDSQALRALMDSIRANGLLEPPTVVPAGDGTYRLISGHSRMAAIKALRETETPDQWATVLCRVLPPMSEGQEQAAVIEANRQRVKSNALLADEAEKLTEAYIKRREAGEQLPGRIRDYVAEALQVKATKVANLSAIKNGLKVPGIVERWKHNEIPEAAALLIARMDLDEQYRLLDWMIDKKVKARVTGPMSDVAICGAIASCDVSAVLELLTPIAVMCVLGFLVSWITFPIARRVFRGNYAFERMIVCWGANTGVTITGMMLLKICDPDYQTPALAEFSMGFALMSIISTVTSPIYYGLIAEGSTMANLMFNVVIGGFYILMGVLAYLAMRRAKAT